MEKDDKKIEELIGKLMSAESLEQPSLDFTNNVMSKVEAISSSTTTVYKPLIPKSVWFLILGSFVALIGYIYLNKPTSDNGWFDRFDLSHITVNPLENLSIDFSTTLMYAVVLLAIMVSIQVPLLKHYLDKRTF
ncbi:hypothetical protein [Winogradskyella schleiferi]|uniref:hypothetical protein n=1 Tax=Winogradskyella schleiferi TaxID=2686078 RepID=UPI0015BED30C|nr:hypothetical protein [Winogradskyella schleiferi]